MKKFSILAVLAFALSFVFFFVSAPAANAAVFHHTTQTDCATSLPGGWNLQVSFPNGTVESTHMQFTASRPGSGYLVENNHVSPGNHYGLWNCDSLTAFSLQFLEPNVVNGVRIGWILVSHPNDVLSDSTHWSGNAQAKIYDLQWNQIGSGTSQVVATKE